jgi:hypothetical protein
MEKLPIRSGMRRRGFQLFKSRLGFVRIRFRSFGREWKAFSGRKPEVETGGGTPSLT